MKKTNTIMLIVSALCFITTILLCVFMSSLSIYLWASLMTVVLVIGISSTFCLIVGIVHCVNQMEQ